MNKIIKNNFLIAMLTVLSCFVVSNVSAQAANSSFSYQGELIDGGSPANDDYDFRVQMIDGLSADVGTFSEHIGVTVTNGLFNLDVNLGGVNYFDGYENYYFEVSVRKTSVAGAFSVLSPVQALQAVPLATNLVNGSATAGQVLTFNGFQWQPLPPAPSSPIWTVAGSEINYMNNVGIGVENPAARLHVVSSSAHSARFEGGNNMYISFYESGVYRGYMGSYTSETGTNDADIDIGTGSGSTGSLQFSTGLVPKMTIASDGKVGIGTTAPSVDLNVDGTTDGDVVRFRVDGSTKFLLDDNGGVAIGSFATPPVDGLDVEGDVKQPVSSNGMMKYMVKVQCSNGGASVLNSYNGISGGAITAANGATDGKCTVTFPDDISDRYFQASAPSGGTGTSNVRGGTCVASGTNDLQCARFNPYTGVGINGWIMILVY